MIQYILNFITWVYRYPVIKQVVKKSIMGFKYDKTLEYYRNITIISPIDEDFIIRYTIDGMEYIIHCNTETYDRALGYIKNYQTSHIISNKILSAYEDKGGIAFDIKNTVVKYSGPLNDFYKNTPFCVKCSDITDNNITIITDDLNIYVFKDDEVICLDSPKFLNIRTLP